MGTHQHGRASRHAPVPTKKSPFACCAGHESAAPNDYAADGHDHGHEHGQGHDHGHEHGHEHVQPRAWVLAIAGVLALTAEMLGWIGDFSWATAPLAAAAIALSGLGTYRSGLRAIARADLNINALMSIAVTGAVLLGSWAEAAMVMVLFSLAEHLEERSLDRARHAVEQLVQVAPQQVMAQDGDGNWASRAAAGIVPGTLLRVAPGERIGLDGRVESGRSSVNQASITGESMPVEKARGDLVYAGTVNGMAELEYRSEAAFDKTVLARIIQAVQQAQASKAPTQRFVDRFARVYTPIVCVLALAVAIIPPLFFQALWSEWVYKALVLLVIACPCALVISTPVAIVSGLAAAARHGILIKGGAFLEQGRKLTWLALDKTGTLTHGKPQLVEMRVLDGNGNERVCRRLATSLAVRSDHPVSRALVPAEPMDLLKVEHFKAVQGGGVLGEINGQRYFLGNASWVMAQLPSDAHRAADTLYQDELGRMQEQGHTVSALASSSQMLALFSVSDTIKPSSQEALISLRDLGVQSAMLSGDHPAAAQYIARQLGIKEVYAGLLPEDKLDIVSRHAEKEVVGMVGDGINDAPALAKADIGFAMGAMGTDTAIETADVALMDDDLRKIDRFIRLSLATHRVLIQNISLALGIKLAFLGLAVAGLGTMWMAVFADVGASLLVVGNSLRLLRH